MRPRPYAWARRIIWLALTGLMLLVAFALLRGRPQDLPWTKLDMARPIGLFTGRKVAALTTDAPACRALLTRAGVRYTRLAPRYEGNRCGFADAVRLTPDRQDSQIALTPAAVGISCPVAIGFKLWEWNIVQPAAQRLLGTTVARIEHFGSYSCRRMYNRSTGDMSEHATADAIDIAAFVLVDGRRISVVHDWKAEGGGDAKDAAFLHAVRDGACTVFATVLSPDYNAAHHDHLHLDQAERGAMGWRACR